jgi:acyl-coenzyme A synthetase/AMP-(fatty) acid ligase
MTYTKFWEFPTAWHSSVALIDSVSGRKISYRELDEMVQELVGTVFARSKQLVLVFCNNRPADIVVYLAALRAGHAVLLLESKLEASLRQELIHIYLPDLLADGAETYAYAGYMPCFSRAGISMFERQTVAAAPVYSELAVLLSTSGTTGSPKLVRLSQRNIAANASSIANYLELCPEDRAITSLPMSYSYGLSVINSHLSCGAALICTNETMAQRHFWDIFRQYTGTSFAGVPYNYQMLLRFGFKTMSLPTLRTMTQAGGRLADEVKRHYIQMAAEKRIRYFVMYGQTEATARISYVPPANLADKVSSIGIAVPEGRLSLRANDRIVTEAGTEGELIYEGPNVMLGYAESRSCLGKGDELQGILPTGDIAYRDSDGYYYITGRLKRFLKVFGMRLNLDEIERALEDAFCCGVACSGVDDKLVIFVEQSSGVKAEVLQQKIVESYRIHGSAVKVCLVAMIPVTITGKKDYPRIKEIALA